VLLVMHTGLAPEWEIPMPAGMLPTIALMAVCFSSTTSASERRYGGPKLKQNATPTLAADRDPYADPAAPYKADRLSSPRTERILNIPEQTTVLTRQVLDDMNATSLRYALRSTAGATVGR
jgi:outer membrane receptor for monomeric catechols